MPEIQWTAEAVEAKAKEMRDAARLWADGGLDEDSFFFDDNVQ